MKMILIYQEEGNIWRTVIYDSKSNRLCAIGSSFGISTREVVFSLTAKNLRRYVIDGDMVNLKNIEIDKAKGIL